MPPSHNNGSGLFTKTLLAKLSNFKVFSRLVDTFRTLSRLNPKIIEKMQIFLMPPSHVNGSGLFPIFETGKIWFTGNAFVLMNQLPSVTEVFN